MKDIETKGIMRRISDHSGRSGARIRLGQRDLLNFASNDYLGLSINKELAEAASEAALRWGSGAAAARLLTGGCPLHRELEERFSGLKGTTDSLLFSSGYAANTGTIPALAGEGDIILSDELNHASIIDGCRLSRASLHIYKHRDMGHLSDLLSANRPRARRCLIATDTVFSMDGDIAPLMELDRLSQEHGAMLYLDDAHGTGVLGSGRGALAHAGIKPGSHIIIMGTFSKALGSFGAALGGPRDVIDWLVNRARSFVFSTALPPASVAASIRAIAMIEEGRAPIAHLWQMRALLMDGLRRLGMDTGPTETPIIPIMLPSVDQALRLSARLTGAGIHAPAIRPPTVRQPRIRLAVSALHTESDMALLLDALKK